MPYEIFERACWRSLDNDGLARALLIDLSKAFDYFDPNLRIANLPAYGLSVDALGLIYDYLSNRKQRVKIND